MGDSLLLIGVSDANQWIRTRRNNNKGRGRIEWSDNWQKKIHRDNVGLVNRIPSPLAACWSRLYTFTAVFFTHSRLAVCSYNHHHHNHNHHHRHLLSFKHSPRHKLVLDYRKTRHEYPATGRLRREPTLCPCLNLKYLLSTGNMSDQCCCLFLPHTQGWFAGFVAVSLWLFHWTSVTW